MAGDIKAVKVLKKMSTFYRFCISLSDKVYVVVFNFVFTFLSKGLLFLSL